MKFTFRLEKVLEQRQAVENAAKRDWAEARAKADAILKGIDDMYQQIDFARGRAGTLSRAGGTQAPELSQIDGFIGGQKIRIERERVKLREQMMEVERLHEVLIEAAKERKTLEKLKERRLADFRLMKKKRELKDNDEIVVTRFSHFKRLSGHEE